MDKKFRKFRKFRKSPPLVGTKFQLFTQIALGSSLKWKGESQTEQLKPKVRGYNKVYGSHARSPSEGIVLLETYWSRPPCFLASSSKVKRVVNSKREGRKHADLEEVVMIKGVERDAIYLEPIFEAVLGRLDVGGSE